MDSSQARPHRLGQAPAEALFEDALARATILNAAQRENARAVVRALVERRTIWASAPLRLILEGNRRCNIACPMCDVQHLEGSDLEPACIEALFEEIGPGLLELQPFGGGEPTLGPIDPLARLARRHNNDLNVITNGLLFDGAYSRVIADITSRVQISLHSHIPQVAERLAVGQPFERVVQNLRDAVEIGREYEAHVMGSTVVMNSNFDHLPETVRFMARLGVKRTGLTRLYPTAGIELRHSPAEIQDKMAEVLEVALECGVFLESNVEDLVYDACNVPTVSSRFDVLIESAQIVEWFQPEACISTAVSAFVEFDGTVLPCYQHRIPLGNLHAGGFAASWNGEIMQRHRAGFMEGSPENYCRICRVFFCNKENQGTTRHGPWLNDLTAEERHVVDLVGGLGA
jgi:MoaA/NifB/PqqE/SkfB family radical SAM enzyme